MSMLRTLNRTAAASALTLATLFSLGCSQSTPPAASAAATPAAPTAAAPTVVPAKDAFFAMYKAGHDWAPDVMAMRLTQKELPGFKNEAGKAAMWEGAFASPSLRQYRVITYSIASVPPTIYKGVDVGPAMPWGGTTRDAMPIDVTLFHTDSNEAFEAAAANAAAWLKSNPGKELTALELGQTYKFAGPVWYTQWGTKAGGYSTLVDATTGKVLNRK